MFGGIYAPLFTISDIWCKQILNFETFSVLFHCVCALTRSLSLSLVLSCLYLCFLPQPYFVGKKNRYILRLNADLDSDRKSEQRLCLNRNPMHSIEIKAIFFFNKKSLLIATNNVWIYHLNPFSFGNPMRALIKFQKKNALKFHKFHNCYLKSKEKYVIKIYYKGKIVICIHFFR